MLPIFQIQLCKEKIVRFKKIEKNSETNVIWRFKKDTHHLPAVVVLAYAPRPQLNLFVRI